MTILNDPAIWLKDFFLNSGLSIGFASFLSTAALIVIVTILSWLANLLAKVIIRRIAAAIVRRTLASWDDIFVGQNVFTRLSHLAPALVIWLMAGWALKSYPSWIIIVHKMANIYIVIIGMVVINSFIEAWHKIYITLPISQHRHIKGYVQLLKILVIILALLTIVSVIFRKDISTIIAGLSAMAAVLLFVFKDVLLGLVASIQLSADNMIKVGDWITMSGRNVDGTVTDITLNTVKIQNFDKTIITVPTYSLVTESFQNWKAMEESGVRQIKRAMFIDIKSIKFLNKELKEKLSINPKIKEIIDSPDSRISLTEGKSATEEDRFFDSGMMTNLGLFRLYAETFLRNHPMIDSSESLMLRHRAPEEFGLPLQVYAFVKNNKFIPFEKIQSEIFEHLFAILNEFDLKVFQQSR